MKKKIMSSVTKRQPDGLIPTNCETKQYTTWQRMTLGLVIEAVSGQHPMMVIELVLC